MPEDTAERLRTALEFNSSEWSRWLTQCRGAWPKESLPSGAVVARAVREFLQLSSSETSSAVLGAIRRSFQIIDCKDVTAPPGEGWAKMRYATPKPYLIENELAISAGRGGSGRSKFVLAHEM